MNSCLSGEKWGGENCPICPPPPPPLWLHLHFPEQQLLHITTVTLPPSLLYIVFCDCIQINVCMWYCIWCQVIIIRLTVHLTTRH